MAFASPPARATDHPGYLLKRAQAVLHAGMDDALREHGATLTQYAVLTTLDEEPGLSNADLARRAFVTPQTMNQVLRELEQKGWVTRHPHPGHARILQADLAHHRQTRRCGPAAGRPTSSRNRCSPRSPLATASSSPQRCEPASKHSHCNHEPAADREQREPAPPSPRIRARTCGYYRTSSPVKALPMIKP